MKQLEKINFYDGMLENSTKFSQGLFAGEEHYLIASIKNNHIYIGYWIIYLIKSVVFFSQPLIINMGFNVYWWYCEFLTCNIRH